MIFKFLALVILLFGFACGGWIFGIYKGYQHGFSEGVEYQKLKAIEKLEPEGDEGNDRI